MYQVEIQPITQNVIVQPSHSLPVTKIFTLILSLLKFVHFQKHNSKKKIVLKKCTDFLLLNAQKFLSDQKA